MRHVNVTNGAILFALAALIVFGLGCSSATVTETVVRKDGSWEQRTVSGGSLLTEKGIQRAKVTGLGEIEGYSSNPSVDAMRAMGEGIGTGFGKAVKP